MNDELRAITKNQRSLDSAVMMSSLMPSEKYSCSGSPLMLMKGSTAMAGRSGSGKAGASARGFQPAWTGGICRFVVIWLRAHVADEAEALARDSADQLLVLAAVADCLSRGIDAAGQGRIRHDPAAPDRSDEIVLADDAIAVLHQVNQQVEHLRLDVYRNFGAPEFAPFNIDLVVTKAEDHARARHPGRARKKQRASQEYLKSTWRVNHSILKVLIGRNVHPVVSALATGESKIEGARPCH